VGTLQNSRVLGEYTAITCSAMAAATAVLQQAQTKCQLCGRETAHVNKLSVPEALLSTKKLASSPDLASLSIMCSGEMLTPASRLLRLCGFSRTCNGIRQAERQQEHMEQEAGTINPVLFGYRGGGALPAGHTSSTWGTLLGNPVLNCT